METDQERRIAKRIVKTISANLIPFEFKQTNPTFVCKEYPLLIAFFHFHKFSFGPCLRIHFGIRMLNDDFPAPALNGPSYEHAGEYEENEQSIEKCIKKMTKICINEGIPWFEKWTDANRLVNVSDSPLREKEKMRLRETINGRQDLRRISESMKMFGLKAKD